MVEELARRWSHLVTHGGSQVRGSQCSEFVSYGPRNRTEISPVRHRPKPGSSTTRSEPVGPRVFDCKPVQAQAKGDPALLSSETRTYFISILLFLSRTRLIIKELCPSRQPYKLNGCLSLCNTQVAESTSAAQIDARGFWLMVCFCLALCCSILL